MAFGAKRADAAPQPPPPARPAAPSDEYREISLTDIARVLFKHRILLVSIVVLSLVGGVAVTLTTPREYRASTSIITLSHTDIITHWLQSRQAAGLVADGLGNELYPALYPDQWDAASGSWKGAPPSRENIASAISGYVSVGGSASAVSRSNILVLSVRMSDPLLARDIAAEYVVALEGVRPHLDNLTRAELFDKYFDGTNAQDAQLRAETAAKEKTHWIVFDPPTAPSSPFQPRPMTNLMLAGFVGVLGGLVVVFAWEWLRQFKVDFARVPPPPK